MIRAKASAAANSVSVSHARRSTTARCIHPDTPPPKLERPIVENSVNNAVTVHGGGCAAELSKEVFIFAFAVVRRCAHS
jgi:hypothetical protein